MSIRFVVFSAFYLAAVPLEKKGKERENRWRIGGRETSCSKYRNGRKSENEKERKKEKETKGRECFQIRLRLAFSNFCVVTFACPPGRRLQSILL